MLYIDSPMRMVGKTIVIVQWWLKGYLIDDVIDFVNEDYFLFANFPSSFLFCVISSSSSLWKTRGAVIVILEGTFYEGNPRLSRDFGASNIQGAVGRRRRGKPWQKQRQRESFWNHSFKKWSDITSHFILDYNMFHFWMFLVQKMVTKKQKKN